MKVKEILDLLDAIEKALPLIAKASLSYRLSRIHDSCKDVRKHYEEKRLDLYKQYGIQMVTFSTTEKIVGMSEISDKELMIKDFIYRIPVAAFGAMMERKDVKPHEIDRDYYQLKTENIQDFTRQIEDLLNADDPVDIKAIRIVEFDDPKVSVTGDLVRRLLPILQE